VTVGAAIVMVVVSAAFGRTTSVSPEVAIPIGLAAVYLQRFQIHPEERILQWRFGDAFNVYPGQVRRWLWWKSRSTMRAGVRTVRVQ